MNEIITIVEQTERIRGVDYYLYPLAERISLLCEDDLVGRLLEQRRDLNHQIDLLNKRIEYLESLLDSIRDITESQ